MKNTLKTATTKRKTKSIKKLKDKAWALCSKYIRLKYSDDNGYVSCYTCGSRRYYKEQQAGHGFSGRTKAVLFMEEVIRPQCYGCNICQSGKLDIFTHKLRKEYGNKKMDKLYLKAHTNQGQWYAEELEKIAKKYKKKLEKLNKEWVEIEGR